MPYRFKPRSFFNWFQGLHYSAFDKSSSLEYPPEGVKKRADWKTKYDEAVAEGAEFMINASTFLPNDHRIYGQLGFLYQQKFKSGPDWCKAAEYYKIAEACPDTKPYYRRFRAYALTFCPGSEQEAYQILKESYDSGKRFGSVLSHLRKLEEFLNVPQSERIPPNEESAK